ncbi:MAG: TetR/AcrR family transcriptional regulator [Deltaproteobacteria bacterium]|nr:TetR/AcrR family transcriptional regulator [Deltaproteobacteria bacterium]
MMTDEVLWSQAGTEKHRRILDAALEMFAEQGYAGTATAEIARKAGVSEAAIFRHYKTKKDLLIGVVAPVLRVVAPALVADVKQIMSQRYPDLRSFLAVLVKDRVGFVRRHHRVLRIALQELPFHPEVRAIVDEVFVRDIYPHATGTITDLQRRGEMMELAPELVMRTIISITAGHAVHRYYLRPGAPFDEAVEMELLVRLLSKALGPER